jgi:hypothetical protein
MVISDKLQVNPIVSDIISEVLNDSRHNNNISECNEHLEVNISLKSLIDYIRYRIIDTLLLEWNGSRILIAISERLSERLLNTIDSIDSAMSWNGMTRNGTRDITCIEGNNVTDHTLSLGSIVFMISTSSKVSRNIITSNRFPK